MIKDSAQPCGCDPGCVNQATGPDGYRCERHRDFTSTSRQPDSAPVARIIGAATVVKSAPTRATTLPGDPAERKKHPIASGVFDYFPDALVAIARVSYEGNEQHNPGTPLHWDRAKSTDEADTLLRHFSERGSLDTDGQRHTAKMAWRALAILQKEIEAERAPRAVQPAEKCSHRMAYDIDERRYVCVKCSVALSPLDRHLLADRR